MGKKVIIFGIGRFFEYGIPQLDMDSVVAFSDNDSNKHYSEVHGKQIIPPELIISYDYDYVVIFTNKFADQIYKQLKNEVGVPEEKIVSWQFFLYGSDSDRKFMQTESMQKVCNIIKEIGCKNILDINTTFARFCIFSKNFGWKDNLSNIHIDGYQDKKKQLMPIYNNIYDNIYSDLEGCTSKEYDIVMLVDLFIDNKVEECAKLIEMTYSMSKYAVITIPYPYPEKYKKWQEYDFAKYGHIDIIKLGTCQIVLIDKARRSNTGNLQIYVATHKPFVPPEDGIYIPIHAGKAGKESLGFEGDDIGENISEWNPLLNECTALYWIWKHSKSDYIGLNHYRRYFLRNNVRNDIQNIVDEETVEKILEEYDIILSDLIFCNPSNVERQLKLSIGEEAFQTGFALIRDIIAQKHSDYLDAFDELFRGFAFYPCNLFITRKEILDQYCEWLFDIIIDAAKQIDVSNYDSYSKRVIGFMAERLLTVWMMKNKLRIKELPLLETE
ncbi:MAG: DUF4422 domain-containing protein [Mobilitalea sp.]